MSNMSCPNFISETTNNLLRAKHHLSRNRTLDIACIYCVQIYRVFPQTPLYTISNNTLCCTTCNAEAMIPIIISSILYKMEPEERRLQMIELNKEWFTPIKDDDSYSDYEYEETKETSFPG